MPRSHFHEKLEEMEMELLTLGELAGNAVQNSVEAVMQQDDALAERVIAEDDEVDRLYIDLDQQMLAPRAAGARGGRPAPDLGRDPLEPAPGARRGPGGQRGQDAAGHARSARQRDDPATDRRDGAHRRRDGPRRDGRASPPRPRAQPAAAKMDDPVDRLNRNMHFEVAKLADEPRALEWGMHMNLAARALERVGDNAVDIGEQVAFLVSGEFREFTDASHPGGVASDAT